MTSIKNIQNQAKNSLPKIPQEVTDPCMHCGFCLDTCASYKVLGTEMDSPRGRIHTLKAIQAQELKLDRTITTHFDTCLGCYACVTACPSGVRYDQLIEAIRPELNNQDLRSPCENLFRKFLLQILPYPKRLRALLQVLHPYEGTLLQDFSRRSGLTRLMGPHLEAMESLLPKLSSASFEDNFKTVNNAEGVTRGSVGLLLGCVQRCFDPDVSKATLAVLKANGFNVLIPNDQGCCGAVAHHQGQLEQTKELATALIQSFKNLNEHEATNQHENLQAILVTASGCGHTMKAYKELLNNKLNFDVPVLDIHEFLIQRGLSENFKKTLKPLVFSDGKSSNAQKTFGVAYHDACHMIHGQGISKEPRDILMSIPNLELLDVTEAGICCGSAGIYNLVKPKEANELGRNKVIELKKTKAKLIASSNIGCTLQLRKHLNQELSVIHPMQLLAYSAGIHELPCL